MPSTKTLRVTLSDIVGGTGGSGSTAVVRARYVTSNGQGRDVHLASGTIVVPVRREVTPGTGPERFDFTVIPSDDGDVREVDQGFLTEVSWTVTAPEGGKTHGVRRVLVPSTADAVVQLGSLYEPTEIPAVTAQRIISGGTASAPLYDIRIRHDDTAGWAAEDPVLSLGEEGIDTDTGTRKVGDGVTAWSSLPASGGGGGGGVTVHSALTGRTAADQHPTSAITGLDAALAGKATAAQGTKADTAVQPARTITAGTGLTGGGDLSANRTLAVAYGTTSTTATVGDDSRVTGAAQKSANLSDLANAGTARTNLGLGTAATTAATAYATAAQGALADSALQAATAQAINAQTGTSYTLVSGDAGKVVTLSNAAAITLNAPGSTFTAGQRVDVVVIGAGMATVVGTSGATANPAGGSSLVSRAQYSAFTILWTSATACVVIGDMA